MCVCLCVGGGGGCIFERVSFFIEVPRGEKVCLVVGYVTVENAFSSAAAGLRRLHCIDTPLIFPAAMKALCQPRSITSPRQAP